VLDEEVGIGFRSTTGPGQEPSPLLAGILFPRTLGRTQPQTVTPASPARATEARRDTCRRSPRDAAHEPGNRSGAPPTNASVAGRVRGDLPALPPESSRAVATARVCW
jgi:hypothetical protein